MVWLSTILDAAEETLTRITQRSWHAVKEAVRPRSFGGPTWTEKVAMSCSDRRQALADWWVYQPEGRRVRLDLAVITCVALMLATGLTTWSFARSAPRDDAAAPELVQGLVSRARKEATDRSTPRGVRAVPAPPAKR